MRRNVEKNRRQDKEEKLRNWGSRNQMIGGGWVRGRKGRRKGRKEERGEGKEERGEGKEERE